MGIKWISVKEEMPEQNNWKLYAVLVMDDKLYRHQIAYYSKSGKWHIESNQKEEIKVTHWYPLPDVMPI